MSPLIRYSEILNAAKQAGIRAVAIDTSLSREAGFNQNSGSKGYDRYLAMNYAADTIITHEKKGGKYIVFCGNTHGSTCHANIETKGKTVPGIAELKGIPFICVDDDPRGGLEHTVQHNVQNHHEVIEYVHTVLSNPISRF